MYIAGNFWRICDVCGFKVRASQTRKQWDGLIVCLKDFEERHPQDFVRGRKDIQNVPEPRPEPIDTLIGNLRTETTADALAGSTTLSVMSSVRFEDGDVIGVPVADGTTYRATIDAVISDTSITLIEPLPSNVASGAFVINYSAVSEPDLG